MSGADTLEVWFLCPELWVPVSFRLNSLARTSDLRHAFCEKYEQELKVKEHQITLYFVPVESSSSLELCVADLEIQAD